MIRDLQLYANQIPELSNLEPYFYENFFKVYQKDGQYVYNILKNIQLVKDGEELNPELYDQVIIDGTYPWTYISYKEYGTIHLWWIILITNKIMNSVVLPKKGTILRILKPEYVKMILSEIERQRDQ